MKVSVLQSAVIDGFLIFIVFSVCILFCLLFTSYKNGSVGLGPVVVSCQSNKTRVITFIAYLGSFNSKKQTTEMKIHVTLLT